jgi:hypothetical protein
VRAFLLGLEQDFRGQPTLDRARELGLNVSVFFGLDARRASNQEIDAIYSQECSRFAIDRPLSPPEIACVWGHQEMRRAFLEGPEEWALLLEDDASLFSPFLPTSEELLGLHDAPVILTLLGKPADGIVLETLTLESGRSFLRLLEPPDYAVAYLINRKAAELSLDSYRGRKIDSVPDWPYRWSREVQFWTVDPPLAGITPMESLLEADRVVLQRQATMRMSPELTHFILSILGVRLLRGAKLGYGPAMVLRHDVLAPIKKRLHRRRHRLAQVQAGLEHG